MKGRTRWLGFEILICSVLLGWAASQSQGQNAASHQAEDSKPLTPVEAIEQIGKPKVLVEMVVKKAKDRVEKRGIIYLDSEDDFKSPKNLGVAISAEAAAKFKEKGITDPAAHLLGKTIRVQGCVMRFEERPYLPVHDPEQIQIIEKK